MKNALKLINNPIDAVTHAPKMNAETYGFASTREIMDAFGAHGWRPVSTQTASVRDAARQGFQKHLVRLENPAFQAIEGLTDANRSKPQLVLLNSHDGTSSLQIFWGLVRIACLNGIIAGTSMSSFRLIHSRKVTERLPDAIEHLVKGFPKFINQIQALQGLRFSDSALSEFIKTVYDARLQGVGKVLNVDYRLPDVKRYEDNGSDAFTVFNRVQETLIRGGIQYRAERNRLDDDGNVIETRIVDAKTRKLSSVQQQVNLNRIVYDTALKLAA
jgi:hypothetical protein